jgi:hypothetical protein
MEVALRPERSVARSAAPTDIVAIRVKAYGHFWGDRGSAPQGVRGDLAGILAVGRQSPTITAG